MAKKLSIRLEAIASMVKEGSYLADVGSDHALLPISLIQRGKISYAQAIDNKAGPFMRMKGNVDDNGLSSRIRCSLSDGLDDLSSEIDTLALCGMGGLLTCEILEKHPEKLDAIRYIICDPHRDLVAVRKRVCALGYFIDDEIIVKENKIYYFLIRFAKGNVAAPYSGNDLYFGPILRKKRDPLYLEWLEEIRKKVGAQFDKNLSPEKKESYQRLYRAIRDEIKGTLGK